MPSYSRLAFGGLFTLAAGAAILIACGSSADDNNGAGGNKTDGSTSASSSTGGSIVTPDSGDSCEHKTCAELGWACGYTVDKCGVVTNCADEGLACPSGQVCVGGVTDATKCVAAGTAGAGTCEVCDAIPDCTGKPQTTKLTGRVISPGRADDNTGNQVGVPNAIVYILQTTADTDIPAITAGIPANGTSCDRCADLQLGPVLVGAVTDATGAFSLEGNIPVGKEFILVVKAGRFRRAQKYTVPAAGACATTAAAATLPDNPTRLPRSMTDGLAVNIPRIAISTGEIDAMECVFSKMGIATTEFSDPGADGGAAPRVHLYRGGNGSQGMKIDNATPADTTLYGDLSRLESYDMLVADCEGATWDSNFSQEATNGAKVREYVNRGGRMFASHLSFSWLNNNGTDADAGVGTGLGPAATWDTNAATTPDTGNGRISTDPSRTHQSPRIANFAAWAQNEGIITATPPPDFQITDPRSQATGLGNSSEEFVYATDGNQRVQQFSFNTPYGSTADTACGRVAYSGFHVVDSANNNNNPFENTTFSASCGGDLTKQEKVLLYMLFDLGACVGATPIAPKCVPVTCQQIGAQCGPAPDGCGQLLDCGSCSPTK